MPSRIATHLQKRNEIISANEWFKRNWHIVVVLLIMVGTVAYLYAVFTIPILVPPYPPSYLELQVSPPGYPEIGAFWRITVYKVNYSEAGLIREYAENAKVLVNVLTKMNNVELYEFSTDKLGGVSFQYLWKHSEVSFEAFLTGYEPSRTIVLNESYVPENFLVQIISFAGVCLALALGIDKYLVKMRKSIFGKILLNVMLFIMLISSFVLVFTFYSFLFKGTSWGFPSEIIAPYITFETLKYLVFVTVILYVSVVFLVFANYTIGREKRNPN